MRDTRQLLIETDFPPIRRDRLDTLQVNLGYRCNLSCTHCHVNAGPKRTEMMDKATVETVLAFIDRQHVTTLDLTGGAPEMNPWFTYLVREARARDVTVIDRCNLTILLEPGYEGMAAFLAGHGVSIVASLPCYTADNVDGQRGKGTFNSSIEALRRLNALGYGRSGTGLALNLVYNPTGPFLPPPQTTLEHDYKRRLNADFGITFNALYTITNMPISRFGAVLLSKGEFAGYMRLLKNSFADANLAGLMCRNTLSVDWQGRVYDCDFNQMLKLPMLAKGGARWRLADLIERDLTDHPIAIGDHCYGCTAGQGSSCGGALG